MNLQLERYSFLKKSSYYKVLRDIVIPFCFKFISKVFRSKVDENLIIMGAYSGNSYMDNTKYLFEFLNKRSNYNVVWFTKSRGLLVELRNKGFYILVPMFFSFLRSRWNLQREKQPHQLAVLLMVGVTLVQLLQHFYPEF